MRNAAILAALLLSSFAAADTHAHSRIHKIKMVTIRRPLDFNGRDYFDLRRPYVS